MKAKFNFENYQKETDAKIAKITAELDEMNNTPRVCRNWDFHQKRQDLECDLHDLKLLRDPKYMCEYMYSDRHAYEVLCMESATTMIVRQLKATRINIGEYYMSDSQDYSFESNEAAPAIKLRLRKNGRWYVAGGRTPFGPTAEPYEYYDFSF